MKFLTYPIKFFRHLIKAKKNLNSVDNYLKNNYCGNDWKHWNSFEKNIWLQLSPIFNNFKIYTIVHVGAHTGAEALAINKLFPGREFYLLEPLPNIYKVLVKNTASYKNMHCINMAAGAGRGLFDMWADEFSPASSLLPYEELAYKEFPYLGKQAITKVNVETLDNILQQQKVNIVDFLIIDVQGYEDKVLNGAEKTLRLCQVIMSELSLYPLYVGSSTFDSVYQKLRQSCFQLKYIANTIKGESTRIIQLDGVFTKE